MKATIALIIGLIAGFLLASQAPHWTELDQQCEVYEDDSYVCIVHGQLGEDN